MRRKAIVFGVLVLVLGGLIALRLRAQAVARDAPPGGSGEIEGTEVNLSARILARVEKILSMKTEDASLDDIADAVSTAPLPETVGAADAVARGILSARALELYAEIHGPADPLRFQELTAAYVLDRLLGSGDVGVEEARAAVGVFEEGYGSFEGRPCDLVIARKMGVAVSLLVAGSAQMVVESGARVVARLGVSESIEQLKSKLR